MTVGDVRVRRPRRHEGLIQELRDEAGFTTMRDVLLLAAAIGRGQGRRTPFDDSSEPIRYETLTEPNYAETLINMIASCEVQSDPEILSPSRLPERLLIFEEYANGGLDFVREQANLRKQALDLLVLSMVSESLADKGGVDPIAVEDLLKGML